MYLKKLQQTLWFLINTNSGTNCPIWKLQKRKYTANQNNYTYLIETITLISQGSNYRQHGKSNVLVCASVWGLAGRHWINTHNCLLRAKDSGSGNGIPTEATSMETARRGHLRDLLAWHFRLRHVVRWPFIVQAALCSSVTEMLCHGFSWGSKTLRTGRRSEEQWESAYK